MNETTLIIEERIARSIFLIREQKVMLDSDLAELYDVPTKVLNQAVKRNVDRFPCDFMFQLSEEEWQNLRSQIVTSSPDSTEQGWGGRRTPPYVFTEQGVAMLSSVLKSRQAIHINIAIMRVFVKIRQWTTNYAELASRIEELLAAQGEHNHHIATIYKIIDELLRPQYSERKPIGFKRRKEM